ncbi:hypothetical protein [Edaphobacter albus]|uniref:hypothetical protein n=1 Tax=Edaphobacter sp. 4G125 TaxID=2763071 RepID=UPI0016479B68|nr:hypothetical protein [Edaphobacter sp. 4G125]QNI37648.1 hypothetical protein H7846_04995 [Edaphobacter sp. 4G125]
MRRSYTRLVLKQIGTKRSDVLFFLMMAMTASAQQPKPTGDHAGFVPIISGGAGYVHNVSGGIPTLEPQINPVLLVPFGRHVLLESRTDFTGFFEREHLTDGPFKGKVFKTVEFVQVEWLANTHFIVVMGKYLLPFGIYNERLQPIWIKNLQDAPITAAVGTRTSGAGDGFQLRGVVVQRPRYTIQYSTYFSARSNINQLQAARTAGGDVSIFLPAPRLEIGTSYQRFLQGQQINSAATYVSWQPRHIPMDLKAEFDGSYYGKGYWLESAYNLTALPVPALIRKAQFVGRIQHFSPTHGGGNSLPRVNNERVDFGLNYYVRDDLRFISSYGRAFSSQGNTNIWNVGLTYRFLFPLWPARRQQR